MPYDRLASVTLQQLRSLAAIARELSFARAADALETSQPALSGQMRALEAIVGARLIERGPGRRRAELTEVGRLLVSASEEIAATLDRVGKAVDTLRGAQGGTVSFGASLYFGGYVFPPLLASFRRKYPGISVRVEVSRMVNVLEHLSTGRLDLAATVGSMDEVGLVGEPLCPHDLVVVGPPDHPLTQRVDIPLSALASEQWVLPGEASSVRRAIEHKAAEAGMRLNVTLEVNDVQAQLNCVANGLGLGLLGTPLAFAGVAAGKLSTLSVEGFPIHLPYYIVYRAGGLSPAAQALRQHLIHSRGELVEMH